MIDTFPFPESGARRWFRHDGSVWLSECTFAVRLPWPGLVAEPADGDCWIEVTATATPALFAHPFDFAATRSEDGTIVDGDTGAVRDVRRYGRVVLARANVDAIRAVWPGAAARFTLANNTAPVGFADVDYGRIVGIVAPIQGPALWVAPEEARRVAHLADEAARAVDRFAADMRAIAKRVLGGGVP